MFLANEALKNIAQDLHETVDHAVADADVVARFQGLAILEQLSFGLTDVASSKAVEYLRLTCLGCLLGHCGTDVGLPIGAELFQWCVPREDLVVDLHQERL